jgi:hypothetical protein
MEWSTHHLMDSKTSLSLHSSLPLLHLTSLVSLSFYLTFCFSAQPGHDYNFSTISSQASMFYMQQQDSLLTSKDGSNWEEINIPIKYALLLSLPILFLFFLFLFLLPAKSLSILDVDKYSFIFSNGGYTIPYAAQGAYCAYKYP